MSDPIPAILGAIERPKDERDFQLGAIQAPISIPSSFLPDNTWLLQNFQGQTPTCGAHAASHLKAILDYYATNGQTQPRYTPRQIWIKIKTFDGYALEAGTDMRSIFKELQNNGAAPFEPLKNDVTLPLADYSAPNALTPDIEAAAQLRLLRSYAFGSTDYDSICQAIYQNKAIILLIKCDNGFWNPTGWPSFSTPEFGHFVVADGYNENALRIIDSTQQGIMTKYIRREYVLPEFIIESGTAIDIPPSVHQALSAGQLSLAQQILQDMTEVLKRMATLAQYEKVEPKTP